MSPRGKVKKVARRRPRTVTKRATKSAPTSAPKPVEAATGHWSAWRTLALADPITDAVLAEILDGGQAFRWNREPGGNWIGTFGGTTVRLCAHAFVGLMWSTPAGVAEEPAATALQHYFSASQDARQLVDALPWRSDAHLARCVSAFPGLRILRQPFGETLLGFLCSATKQIVQIKQMLALLAARHGAPIAGGGVAAHPWEYRLPTWPELAQIPEPELRRCLLGFRARYIHATARFLAQHPGWLEETETLPYAQAKERLCSLPGVGEKVADCVLLFGAGKLEAFPVDVWIIKAMAERYGLAGWSPAQIAHFGRTHFGPLAGLAQQYLFAFERQQARASRRGSV